MTHILGQHVSHLVDGQIAVQLASIAYGLETNSKQIFPSGWSLAWKPDAAVHGIYAYVANNDDGSQYVVAIRGSLLELSWAGFYNWIDVDLDVLKQDTWVYPPPSSSAKEYPKVSRGSTNGLGWFNKLTSGGAEIGQFILGLPKGVSVGVTGHSLGGGLATVVAPWLQYQAHQAKQPIGSMPVYTFAAPAVGNEQFAQAYDAQFPKSFRYHNVLDLVPSFAVVGDVIIAGVLYSPKINSFDCKVKLGDSTVNLVEAFFGVGSGIKVAEITEGFETAASSYTQTNARRGDNPLNQNYTFGPIDPNECACLQYFHQVGFQHSIANYMKFLGV